MAQWPAYHVRVQLFTKHKRKYIYNAQTVSGSFYSGRPLIRRHGWQEYYAAEGRVFNFFSFFFLNKIRVHQYCMNSVL